jgi:MEDS: MEthanogen/methylotroph, DcmR Sensory domain
VEQVVDSQVEAFRVGPRDHLVLFYKQDDHDAELIAKAGDYLLGALREHGTAIVVGTWEHRLALARHLLRAGVDVAAARAAGDYRELDAGDTVRNFVAGGHADPAHFWAQLSPVIRDAAESGQPVRVFGEMVALLWHADQVGAAIELEAMWNELAAQFPFSLLCAYPLGSVAPWPVAPAGQADQLTEVCRAHTAVTGKPDWLVDRR